MTLFHGQLFVFSGVDGSGSKSTQIKLLINNPKKKGKSPIYIWSRGWYTRFFQILKTLIRHVLGKKIPPSGPTEKRQQLFWKPFIRGLWLSLAIVDLIFVYGIYVRLHKILRRIVLADRYFWDTWIDFRLNSPGVSFNQWNLWKILDIPGGPWSLTRTKRRRKSSYPGREPLYPFTGLQWGQRFCYSQRRF